MKLREGTPEQSGVSASRVAQIKERAEIWVKEGVHQALVLLAARHGTIFLHEAFGKLTPEEDSPDLPRDALFTLASLTKPFTATTAMILAEEGRLGPSRRVQEYIPEFVGDGKEKVLVHQLLTHTSGLDDEPVIEAIDRREEAEEEVPPPDETAHPTIHQWTHYGFDVPLGYEPGTKMLYSSYGLFVLAEIVRRLTGQSLQSFAKDRIFDPLGMKDSDYSVPEGWHHRIVIRPEGVPESFANQPDHWEQPSPSNGIFSTALDTAAFGQMFLNQGSYGDTRVLSPVTTAVMTRNCIPGISASFLNETFPEAGWGLGWSTNAEYKGQVYGEALPSRSTFLHSGRGGVVLWIDPVLEIVGVFFSVVLGLSETESDIWNADLFMNMVTAAVEDVPN